ncbi:MAG: ribonuclease III [Dokdonella sp.]
MQDAPDSAARVLGHTFTSSELIEQALTHRSAGRRNYERLEFLGDGLLNLLVAEMVYETWPQSDEGEMTRLRSALVNGSALAELARGENLGERLKLGPGEMKTGGHRRDSILADAFEATIAAIYLDAGYEQCRERVRALFSEPLKLAGRKVDKDAKTALQETLQARGLEIPQYELLETTGKDHQQVFEVACIVEALDLRETATGSSRRGAEQVAAEQVLALLPKKPRRADS